MKKLISILILLPFILINCKDSDNAFIDEGSGTYENGKTARVGFKDSVILTDYKAFNKSISTQISTFWIDGVQVVVNNDTVEYKNEVVKINDIWKPLSIMKNDDFYIEKPDANTKKVIVKLKENKSNQIKEYIFWFGTNVTYADKLIIRQGVK